MKNNKSQQDKSPKKMHNIEETDAEKKYRKEKELREMMGEFDSTYTRRNGAVKRKR